MREILFRGKRIDNGEWSKGDLLYDTEQNEAYIAEYFEARAAYFRQVIPETVGQYTGLTDKNGKRIFEGDILTATADGNISTYKVVFMNGIFGLVIKNGGYDCPVVHWQQNCLEIIGNIHDNPELFERR